MEIPKIFESEYHFCEILWEHEPVSSSELVRLCNEKLEWKKSTTYTVIRRLSERGVIQSENAIVTSLISKEQVQAAESMEVVESRFRVRSPTLLLLLPEQKRSLVRKWMKYRKLLMPTRIRKVL